MSSININGKQIELPKGDISIIGNKVYCDGKLIENFENYEKKNINIRVEGCVAGNIESDNGNITINGSCISVTNKNGDVNVDGTVYGSVTTKNGNVRCRTIRGIAETKNGMIIKTTI